MVSFHWAVPLCSRGQGRNDKARWKREKGTGRQMALGQLFTSHIARHLQSGLVYSSVAAAAAAIVMGPSTFVYRLLSAPPSMWRRGAFTRQASDRRDRPCHPHHLLEGHPATGPLHRAPKETCKKHRVLEAGKELKRGQVMQRQGMQRQGSLISCVARERLWQMLPGSAFGRCCPSATSATGLPIRSN
jgi:hypothetical protein